MNRTSTAVRSMVLAALLSAIGVAIPMFSPIKLVIGPASFTLASHVPIFIAMFLSPTIAAAVALVTALGFLLGGFTPVIVLRALTHIVFAVCGALFLRRQNTTLESPSHWIPFAAILSLLHAFLEMLVVIPFYYAGALSAVSYSSGFFTTIIALIGGGGVVHSMIDFVIALWIWRAIAPVQRLHVGGAA